MADVLRGLGGARQTPQSQPARADQVENSAGGYVFKLHDDQRLMRFLILGVDSPTYYASAQELALENTAVVSRMVADELQGRVAVAMTVDVSEAGRAKKNEPALWVLAAAAASPHATVRRLAMDALPRVARTGTHLFTFASYVEKHRGWGRGLRRGVARWYIDKQPSALAVQGVKYRSRDGWAHKDMLALAHGDVHGGAVKFSSSQRRVINFMQGQVDRQGIADDEALQLLEGFLRVQEAGENLTPKQARQLVTDFALPREALPTHVLDSPDVWTALLPHMGMTALIRNLPTMTRAGVLTQLSQQTTDVARRLADFEQLRRGRIHPLSLLVALQTYSGGHSLRGGNTWSPVQKIVDALDAAFYVSFGAVVPTGKRLYVGLDISSSMTGGIVCDSPGVTPHVASAAMAMVYANTEDNVLFRGFSTSGGSMWGSPRMIDIPISRRMRLDDALNRTRNLPFGGTDCALPMIDAMQMKERFDAFIIFTDSETHAGGVHPHQALQQYRNTSGVRHARLIVVGMTSTGFSIADPLDPGHLDVVGFDTATPEIMSGFIRGDF